MAGSWRVWYSSVGPHGSPLPRVRKPVSAPVNAPALARRAGIRSIDRATLEQWRDDTTRTTYVFDVRDRDEYEAGHLAGARNAPEGALVMSPDHYMGTQNARCVLVDDDTVRATIAALWLSQMGRCTPYVLDDASLDGALTETGPEPRQVLGLDSAPSATMTPQALDALVRHANPLIIDVGNSAAYVLSHVPGARWCLRSALARTLASTAASGSPLVLTSADGVMASLPPATWRSWAARTCWCLRAATPPGVGRVSRQPAGRRICSRRVTTCGSPRPSAQATRVPMSWRTSTGRRRSWRRLNAAAACRSATSYGTNGAGLQR